MQETRSRLDKATKLILHGDGGVGKSTLAYQAAAWLAHEKRIGLAWVSAAGREGLTTDDFAGLLADGLGCEAAIGPVCAQLRTGPYLLVLDNVDSADPGLPRALAAVFPGNCWLLLTTRVVDDRLRDLATNMPLGTMLSDEAERYAREEAGRQEVALPPQNLTRIVGIARQNPEVIRWLVGQAAMDRLDLATQDVEAGRGEAVDQVFGRTWDNLTLPERTALCALTLVPSGTRESVALATADPSADQTLGRLRQWAVATHDGAGSWSVTGLTRGMAQARIFDVLDAWLETRNDAPERATAALLAFWGHGPLQEFLRVRGFWPQRVSYGERVLDIARGGGDATTVALIAGHLANAYLNTGNADGAQKGLEEALAAFRELGNDANVAVALHQLGVMAQRRGDLSEAEHLYAESLDIERRVGNQGGMAQTLHQLGNVAYLREDLPEAERFYNKSLDIERQLGNQQGIAQTLGQLGILAADRGDYTRAELRYRECLGIFETLGDQADIAISLHQLGRLAETRGEQLDLEQAVGRFQEALDIFKRLGSPDAQTAERSLARVRERLAQEGDAAEESTEEDAPDAEDGP